MGSSLCKGPTLGAKRLQLPATPLNCLLPPHSSCSPQPAIMTSRSLAEGTRTAVLGFLTLKVSEDWLSAQIGKAFGQFPAEMSETCI